MKLKINFGVEFVSVWLSAFVIAVVIFVAGFYALKLVKVEEQLDNELFEQAIAEAPADSEDSKKKNVSQSSTPVEDDPIIRTQSSINSDDSWSYRGKNGPELWGRISQEYRTCAKGRKQSPIDVRKAVVKEELSRIKFLYKPSVTGEFALVGRNLVFKPLPGNVAIFYDESYYLSHVAFHAPSEHRLDSIPYDMEIQFVHENSEGKTIIISVLAEEKATPNPIIAKLWARFPTKKDSTKMIKNVNLVKIFPKDRRYFNYEGSLTTPPCTEGVQWFVLEKTIDVSGNQVERLLQSMKFNARPLQLLHGRAVYKNPR